MKDKTSPPSFSKQYERLVEQADVLLPQPAWLSTGQENKDRQEKGDAIYESGKNGMLKKALVHLIEQASEMVVISSFLFADETLQELLLKVAQKGIRVYLLTASEMRLEQDPHEADDFDKKVIEKHKKMLKKLGGYIFLRSARHFHAKMVLVDPYHRQPQGFLLTANLTSEALERNEEMAVKLTPEEVKEARSLVRWAMWEEAEHEMLNDSTFSQCKPLGKETEPPQTIKIVATTSRSQKLREQVEKILQEARSEIMVSSFGWDAEHSTVRLLCQQAQKGLNVTVLARYRPATMPALEALAKAGAKVFGFKYLHAKAIWTDQKCALVMSANLQKHGLDEGFEVGVSLQDKRAEEIHERLTRWTQVAPWQLSIKTNLGEAPSKIMVLHEKKWKELTIEEEKSIDLGILTARFAEILETDVPEIPPPPEKGFPHMARRLRLHWKVEASTLSKNAKEQSQTKGDKSQPSPYNPPVYKESDGQLVVAVSKPNELEEAAKLKKSLNARAIVRKNSSS